MATVGTWWMWLGFAIFIMFAIVVDIIAMGGKESSITSIRKALFWVLVWMSLALLFNVGLWWYLGGMGAPELATFANQKALEFFTGYLIEQSLSIDNLFVFILIFNYFQVPPRYQRRVLLLGVLGAMIMRLIMILSGTWLVMRFHWILYIFGFFLVATGLKILWTQDSADSLEKNGMLNFLRRHMRVTTEFHGEKFIIKKNLMWYVTPLFLTLILIEMSDLVFALDSIPAIFAITHDPFIIFTANFFAIMGLRALYFVLARLADKFYLLKYGIAVVLILVGMKMLIAHWINVPIQVTLFAVVLVLGLTMLLSLFRPPRKA